MAKKSGFTLVEVMVVVIILGVLAAVGLPKMFGVIAKAKAAEIPVAAGTYISLQNTYLHENNGVGSWQNIGYAAPDGGQSEYFEYRGCIQGTIAIKANGKRMVGWQAFNKSSLNDCQPYSTWSVVLEPLDIHKLRYRHLVSSIECGVLTTSWDIGNAGVGACEATAEITSDTPPNTEEEPEDTDEEPSSDPTPSSAGSTQSSNVNQSSSSKSQVDCEALMATGHASDPRNIKGGHCGWCYVQECRLAVNKGQSGLSVDECVRLCDYEKDHDVEGEIKQYEEEQKQKQKEQEQQEQQEQQGQEGQEGQSGGDGNGQGGGSGNGAGGVYMHDEETPSIKDQNGNDVDYESLPDEISCKTSDCCTSYKGNSGKCASYKSIPKSQCAVYNTGTRTCTQTVESP